MAVTKTKAKAFYRKDKDNPPVIDLAPCSGDRQKPGSSRSASRSIGSANSSLQALTSAALVLPGLMLSSAKAEYDSAAGFQFSHYQEGKRNLFNVPNNLQPIEVDTVSFLSNLSLADRLKFTFQFTQDTWSGATPVTTAPLVSNGNRPVQEDSSSGITTVGASPLINSQIALDSQLNPLDRNSLEVEPQLVHILSFASPETRKQGVFSLSYEWDEAALDINGGLSLENDYESHYGSLGGRWDFNQKLSSLKLGLSYTESTISAILDHDAAPYITKTAFADRIERRGGSEIFNDTRQDWGTNLGLTQVINKNALIETTFAYTHSSGYLANPYKAVTVVFVDPESQNPDPDAPIIGDIRALFEQRPDERNQFTFGAHYVHYIDPFDAALHLNYQFSHDDWDINAHTFEADWVQPLGNGWTISPRIRYYSQDAANFYKPFLVSRQAFRKNVVDPAGREIWVDASNPDNGIEYFRDENFTLVDQNGNVVDESILNVQNKTTSFDPGKLPANFASEYRLSGYGALSGGVTVSKQFTKGVTLEVGIEYYTHAGRLQLGGDGAGDFADFDYYVANAALNVNLASLNQGGGHSNHGGHSGHGQHSGQTPSGVMNGHMIDKAGGFMVGYRFMWGRKAGDTLHGTGVASDQAIVNNGCSDSLKCRFTPTYMNMSMHMFNLMYAPTDWLNLMLMPQFLEKEMNLRGLSGRPDPVVGVHEHTGIAGHATGGVGDTIISSLVKLFDVPGHHLHMGLGFSAPTGDVDLQFRRVFQIDGGIVHFGMQLGSGTWDLLPNLTYTGEMERWSWGAQLSGITRLEGKNESGYRLGDMFQSTAWGSYHPTHWLSASMRGIYTSQGAIKGDFNGFNGRSGPMDFPANYGGQFWDLGFGINVSIPSGALAGNSLSFEWLQPIQDDVNGYQLEREGALSASWSYSF